ncbi:hypothetical protein LJR027_003487 [Terrabacter sp. LjRoot27]
MTTSPTDAGRTAPDAAATSDTGPSPRARQRGHPPAVTHLPSPT